MVQMGLWAWEQGASLRRRRVLISLCRVISICWIGFVRDFRQSVVTGLF